jgi:hypothetical protein
MKTVGAAMSEHGHPKLGAWHFRFFSSNTFLSARDRLGDFDRP